MKKALLYMVICVMSLVAFASCDVHEFPEDTQEKIPFYLHLDFNTELPLYKEVVYSRNGEVQSKGGSDGFDVRYLIKAYNTDNARSNSRAADATFVFTKSDITDLNYTARLDLPEGTYDFKVWADYVDANSRSDKYYDTSDFAEIILANKKNHPGSNDFRDAFRGYATATVKNPAFYTGSIVGDIDNQATAEMKRPMGKFKFITTDVHEFINILAESKKKEDQENGKSTTEDKETESDSRAGYESLLQSINKGEYYVVFKYNAFMPCSYNIFTDKPADSWTGMSFISHMYAENDNDIALGYDYIFVNGSETTLSISVEVYNNNGELMSSSNPINVPIVRSKMTIVKGEFLTSKASGGVSINPGYDGEDYNIEITF